MFCFSLPPFLSLSLSLPLSDSPCQCPPPPPLAPPHPYPALPHPVAALLLSRAGAGAGPPAGSVGIRSPVCDRHLPLLPHGGQRGALHEEDFLQAAAALLHSSGDWNPVLQRPLPAHPRGMAGQGRLTRPPPRAHGRQSVWGGTPGSFPSGQRGQPRQLGELVPDPSGFCSLGPSPLPRPPYPQSITRRPISEGSCECWKGCREGSDTLAEAGGLSLKPQFSGGSLGQRCPHPAQAGLTCTGCASGSGKSQ